MLVQSNYAVLVRDIQTGYCVVLETDQLSRLNDLAKSAIRDIKAVQGLKNGRVWERYIPFKNTPMDKIKITCSYEVLPK